MKHKDQEIIDLSIWCYMAGYEEAIKTLQSFHVTEKSIKAAFEAAMRKREKEKTPSSIPNCQGSGI